MYAIQWAGGMVFDLSKTQVKTHRSRLRKIGIDIALVCDLSKFSPVRIKEAREIEKGELVLPDWYRPVNGLRLVA